MLRKLLLAATSAATMMAISAPLSAAETVRIETRPFYGATVTLEEGVRVFRPLPADKRVVINPGGRTPLSLNFQDSRSVSNNFSTSDNNYHYNDGSNGNHSDGYAGDGYPRYGSHHFGGLHQQPHY